MNFFILKKAWEMNLSVGKYIYKALVVLFCLRVLSLFLSSRKTRSTLLKHSCPLSLSHPLSPIRLRIHISPVTPWYLNYLTYRLPKLGRYLT